MTGISKATFDKCDTDDKLSIMFDLLTDVRDHQTKLYPAHVARCDERFKKLEQAKIANTASAGGMGIIGAALVKIAEMFSS